VNKDTPNDNKANDVQNAEYAAVCDSCDYRESAADYIAADLVAEAHEHENVEVLPVAFQDGGSL
jgi:hypothetical protein